MGNCVNPLTSLTPPQVYGLPMLLLVGWRGEPGKRDEPQHMHKGYVTPGLLGKIFDHINSFYYICVFVCLFACLFVYFVCLFVFVVVCLYG